MNDVFPNVCRSYSLTVCPGAAVLQESCAIAKMTAQCALYMGALDIFGTLWIRARSLFSKNFNGLLFALVLQMYTPNQRRRRVKVQEGSGRVCHQWLPRPLPHTPYNENSQWIFTFCMDPTWQLDQGGGSGPWTPRPATPLRQI